MMPTVPSVDASAAVVVRPATGEHGVVSLTQEATLLRDEIAKLAGRTMVSHQYALCFAIAAPARVRALRAAWTTTVRRHPALRTAFARSRRYPPDHRRRQLQLFARTSTFLPGLFEARVSDAPGVDVEERRVRTAGLDSERELVGEIAAQLVSRATDFHEEGHRAVVVSTGGIRDYFIVTVSHLVADGWSARLIEREFVSIYASLITGAPISLPEAPPFAAFAAAERDWVLRGDTTTHLRHWAEQWRQASSAQLSWSELSFRAAGPATARRTRTQSLSLSPAQSAAIRAYIRSRGITAHALFRTAFMAALCGRSHRHRTACWANFANRRDSRSRSIVGPLFTRHLLVFDATGGLSCDEACRATARVVSRSQLYESLPFSGLLLRLGIPLVSTGTNITFDSSWHENVVPAAARVARPLLLRDAKEWIDLDLRVLVGRDGCALSATYNASRYDSSGITQLLGAVVQVARMCVSEPGQDVRRCIDAATSA